MFLLYLPLSSSSLGHLFLRAPLIVAPILIAVLLLSPTTVKKPEAIVTFCFDDGYKSVMEANGILQKYDYAGTVFVITSEIGKNGYLSLEDLKKLSQEGWEIGSHTFNHLDLTKLSAEDLKTELQGSKQWLEKQGFKIYSLAYPYGEYNKEVTKIAKKYYSVARTVNYGINSLPLSKNQLYTLKSVDVNKYSVEEVKKLIDQAIIEKDWLILTFHRIGQNKDQKTYTWSKNDLEAITRYLRELKFKGINFQEIESNK